MGVDLAHEAVLIPAERWQRWREIAREIDNDGCALAEELCNANAVATRWNLYWAATAARILVQCTTGDQQKVGERNCSRRRAAALRRLGGISAKKDGRR
jgi:hypothetical protein